MTEELKVGFRDAVHVPFVVVKCLTDLKPGDKVSLRGNSDYPNQLGCVPWGGQSDRDEPMWHGVADPFSVGTIPAGTQLKVWIRSECWRRLHHTFDIEVHDRDGTSTCHEVCDIW